MIKVVVLAWQRRGQARVSTRWRVYVMIFLFLLFWVVKVVVKITKCAKMKKAPEGRDACLKFFWAGNHRQDYADVLHRRHGLPRTSGKGLGGGFGGGYKQSPGSRIGEQGLGYGIILWTC